MLIQCWKKKQERLLFQIRAGITFLDPVVAVLRKCLIGDRYCLIAPESIEGEREKNSDFSKTILSPQCDSFSDSTKNGCILRQVKNVCNGMLFFVHHRLVYTLSGASIPQSFRRKNRSAINFSSYSSPQLLLEHCWTYRKAPHVLYTTPQLL